jgi:hypothetical protein
MTDTDLLQVANEYFGTPAKVSGADRWHWVKATNTINGWSVSQGDAEVIISGESFEAKLFSGTDEQVLSSLRGTIRKANVTANLGLRFQRLNLPWHSRDEEVA